MTDNDNVLLLLFWTQTEIYSNLIALLIFDHSPTLQCLPKTPFELPLNWLVEPSYHRPTLFANMLPWLLPTNMSRDLLQPMTTHVKLFNLSQLTLTGHTLVKWKLELNL